MKLTNELKNLTQATAEELLHDVINCVQQNYSEFIRYLTDEDMFDAYEAQGDFVRRLMFFDYAGDTKNLRQVVRTWILYTGDRQIREKSFGPYGDSFGWYDHNVESMDKIREGILSQNPILSDATIPSEERMAFLERILKYDKTYQSFEKDFTRKINGVCARIVSHEINPNIWMRGLKNLYQ